MEGWGRAVCVWRWVGGGGVGVMASDWALLSVFYQGDITLPASCQQENKKKSVCVGWGEEVEVECVCLCVLKGCRSEARQKEDIRCLTNTEHIKLSLIKLECKNTEIMVLF